jgi:RNA polymerase sigma-70 factor, ECF subfamily
MPGSSESREDRFTALYARHYDAVRAYAWRRGPDDADDVVAETFLVAWHRLDQVPAESLPWLFAVARNVRRNMERGERRRRLREERGAAPLVPSAVITQTALEDRSALRTALSGLSESDREVLMLAAWEHVDRAGMAAALGCSKSAAAVRLFRAKRRLAAKLAAAAGPAAAGATSQGGLDEC